MTLRPYLPVKGILGGALAGLAIVVLMQQFAVVYPSRGLAVVAVVGGALAVLVMCNLVRAVAVGRRVPAAAAHAPAPRAAAPLAPASAQATSGFQPTHRAPAAGLDAYEAPGAATTVARLDGGLEVQVLQRSGDWTQVVCSNGWTTWVDGRLLVGA